MGVWGCVVPPPRQHKAPLFLLEHFLSHFLRDMCINSDQSSVATGIFLLRNRKYHFPSGLFYLQDRRLHFPICRLVRQWDMGRCIKTFKIGVEPPPIRTQKLVKIFGL